MKKKGFLFALLGAVALVSCDESSIDFTPEAMGSLVNVDESIQVNGNDIRMIYVPEVFLQNSIDVMNEDRLKIVVQPAFYIQQTEVTQGLYQSIMGSNPSKDYIGENVPVNYLNLYEAKTFIAALNTECGETFRLPSTNEWTYAAAGGAKTSATEYAGSDDISAVAWYSGNSNGTPHTVGLKAPNSLGIYDMSGNISEWSEDTRYNDDGTANGDVSGNLNGGNYTTAASVCVVNSTVASQPVSNTHWTYGFRLAKDASSGVLIDLDGEDMVLSARVEDELCQLSVFDSAEAVAPSYTIALNLISTENMSSWEFYPSDSYVIIEVGTDYSGMLYNADGSLYGNIISGFMGLREGALSMDMTVKCDADGKFYTITSSSKDLLEGAIDVSDVYVTSDPTATIGAGDDKVTLTIKNEQGAGFDVKLIPYDQYDANKEFEKTAEWSDGDWSLYIAASIGSVDFTISEEGTEGLVDPSVAPIKGVYEDGSTFEITSGTFTLVGDGTAKIVGKGLTSEGESLSISSELSIHITPANYDVTGKTVTATVDASDAKSCVFTITDGSTPLMINAVVGSASTAWDFSPAGGSTVNYDIEILTQITSIATECNGVEGQVQKGKIAFSNNIFMPSLYAWVDNVYTLITGMQLMQ